MPVVSVGQLTITDVNDGLNLMLSNESHNIPTDAAGNSPVFTGAVSTAKVLAGGTDVTSSWTITAVSSVGVSGTFSNNTYTVTGMTVDVGTVDFTATKPGQADLTARFTLTKSKKGDQGNPGLDGLTIVVSNESHTLPANSSGTVSSYANSGTTIRVYEGSVELNAVSGASSNGSFGIGTPTQLPASTITVGATSYSGKVATVAPHSAMVAGTDSVVITFPITIKRANGSVVSTTKSQTLTKSKQGGTGGPGPTGPTGPRGSVHLFKLITGSLWSDAEANSLFASGQPHNPVRVADRVTLYNSSAGFSQTRAWTGSAWQIQTEVLDGNLLVTKSVTAAAINTEDLYAQNVDVTGSIRVGNETNYVQLGGDDYIRAQTGDDVVFLISKTGHGFVQGRALLAGSIGPDAFSSAAIQRIRDELGGVVPNYGGTQSISQYLESGTYPLDAINSGGTGVEVSFFHLGADTTSFVPAIPSVTISVRRDSTIIHDQTFTGASLPIFRTGASFQTLSKPSLVIYRHILPVIDWKMTDKTPGTGSIVYSVVVTVSNYPGGNAGNFTFIINQSASGGDVVAKWDKITDKPETATRWPKISEVSASGKLQAQSSGASFNLPRQGTSAPSGTVSGDLWYHSNHLYYNDQGTVRAVAHTDNWSEISEAAILAGTESTSRFISARRLAYAFNNIKAAKAAVADNALSVSWVNVSDKPIIATRWPAFSEVTGTAAAAQIPSLDAGKVTTGTFAAARIPTGISITGNAGTVTNGVYTNGSYSNPSWLTGLDASKLSSGTLPNDRLSGSYTGLVNLTGSGNVDFAKFLGDASDTASAPSYSWTGDLNTGMWRPGEDQIGFATGGVNRVTISDARSIFANEVATTSANSFRMVNSNTGVFFRLDGSNFYLMKTAAADPYGNWTTDRPLSMNLATGILSINGNAATATVLQTARSINGTNFNGSSAITTANWGTARTLTIGNTGKSVNGSGNVSWSLAEIGAMETRHFNAIVRVGTWSRIARTNVTQLGGTYLLALNHTRDNVVVNAVFLIASNHSQSRQIVQLMSGNYTQVQVRLTDIDANDAFIEVLDTAGGSGDNTYNVRLSNLGAGGCTPISSYQAGGGTVRAALSSEFGAYKGPIIAEGQSRFNGNIVLNDNTLNLRQATDSNHFLRWSPAVDGPELIGYLGGRLGSSGTGNIALRWDQNGYCYFGNWVEYRNGEGMIYANSTQFYSVGGGKMVLRGNEGETWLRMETHGSVVRGHVYADGSGIGFLNSAGSWVLRAEGAGAGNVIVKDRILDQNGVKFMKWSDFTPNMFLTQQFMDENNLNLAQYDVVQASFIAAGVLGANLIATNGFNVVSAPDDPVQRKFTLYPGIANGKIAQGKLFHFRTVNANGDDDEDLFYIDTQGEGYFKGSLARGNVDSKAISESAKRAINPYYTGDPDAAVWTGNELVGSGGATTGTVSIGNANQTPVRPDERVTVVFEIRDLYGEQSLDYPGWQPYTDSTYTITLQRRVGAGSWVNVAGQSTTYTVAGFNREPYQTEDRDGRPTWEGDYARSYNYRRRIEFVDVGSLTGRTTELANVQYRLFVNRTVTGIGTSGGLRFRSIEVEKDAFIKNTLQETGFGGGIDTSSILFIDKESGYATYTTQVRRSGSGTIAVTFPKAFKTVHGCTLGYSRGNETGNRFPPRYGTLTRTGVTVIIVDGDTSQLNTVTVTVTGTMDR